MYIKVYFSRHDCVEYFMSVDKQRFFSSATNFVEKCYGRVAPYNIFANKNKQKFKKKTTRFFYDIK